MVGGMTFKITGLNELEAKLKGLGPLVATKIGDDSLLAASKPISAEMRRLVPVKTGRLKRSIATAKNSVRGTSILSRVIGFKSPGRYYSHLVEFGTVHSAPRPFVRPALNASSKSLLEMGRRLWMGIEAYSIGKVLTSLQEDEE